MNLINVSTQSTVFVNSPSSFISESPAFLITIATEGDDLWNCPREVTTENSVFLRRFQELCERWRLRPTYLVDYDMARWREFVDFVLDAIRRPSADLATAPETSRDCGDPFMIRQAIRKLIRSLVQQFLSAPPAGVPGVENQQITVVFRYHEHSTHRKDAAFEPKLLDGFHKYYIGHVWRCPRCLRLQPHDPHAQSDA